MPTKYVIWRYIIRRKGKSPTKPKNYAFQNPAELAGWIINIPLNQDDSITFEFNKNMCPDSFKDFLARLLICLDPANFVKDFMGTAGNPIALKITRLHNPKQ
jgi:hypothetical protein